MRDNDPKIKTVLQLKHHVQPPIQNTKIFPIKTL